MQIHLVELPAIMGCQGLTTCSCLLRDPAADGGCSNVILRVLIPCVVSWWLVAAAGQGTKQADSSSAPAF